jgi:hypothetical protein
MTSRIQGSAGAEQLRAISESPQPQAESTAAARPAVDPERFKQALGSLGREIDKGEKLVQRALHGGGKLAAGDLIALQAGIYRYSEAVDLAAKLVDRAGNAIRTTLQSSGGG